AADGVEFTELAGVHVGIFSIEKDKSNLQKVMEIAKKAFAPQARLRASMLQDLGKKRKTEIDYINGVISTKGKELGIATPYNDIVVQLVKQAENNKIIPQFEKNIEAFTEEVTVMS